MNMEVKIDESVISSVTDIGHVIKHVKMMRKVREHLRAVSQKQREYNQQRKYKL